MMLFAFCYEVTVGAFMNCSVCVINFAPLPHTLCTIYEIMQFLILQTRSSNKLTNADTKVQVVSLVKLSLLKSFVKRLHLNKK